MGDYDDDNNDDHDNYKENQEKHMAPIDCSGLPRTAGFNSEQNLLKLIHKKRN